MLHFLLFLFYESQFPYSANSFFKVFFRLQAKREDLMKISYSLIQVWEKSYCLSEKKSPEFRDSSLCSWHTLGGPHTPAMTIEDDLVWNIFHNLNDHDDVDCWSSVKSSWRGSNVMMMTIICMMLMIVIEHLASAGIVEKALGRFSVHGWIVLKRKNVTFLQIRIQFLTSIHGWVMLRWVDNWFGSYHIQMPCFYLVEVTCWVLLAKSQAHCRVLWKNWIEA